MGCWDSSFFGILNYPRRNVKLRRVEAPNIRYYGNPTIWQFAFKRRNSIKYQYCPINFFTDFIWPYFQHVSRFFTFLGLLFMYIQNICFPKFQK
jgi:hypothetical protein